MWDLSSWLIILLSLIISITYALHKRRPNDALEYWVNNRQTKWRSVGASLSSSIIGAGTLFGVAQAGYLGGNAGAFIGLAYSLGMLIFGWKLAPVINAIGREKGFVSFGDFLNDKLGGTAVTRLCAGIFALTYLFFTAAQFTALAETFGYLFGTPYAWSLAAATAAMLLYVIVGGLRADIRSDSIQLVFMVILVCGLLWVALSNNNTLWAKYVALPRDYLTGAKYQGWEFLIAAIVLIPASIFVSIDVWQRALAAESPQTASRGFYFGSLLMAVMFVGFSLIGTFAFILDPSLSAEAANRAVLHFVRDSGGGILAGFLVAGLIAALLSTADTMILACTISLAHDLASRPTLGIHRPVTIAVIGVAVIFAYSLPDIVSLIVKGFTSLLILLPCLFAIFFEWWRHERALLASLFMGITSMAVFMFIEPVAAFVPASIVTFFTFFVARTVGR